MTCHFMQGLDYDWCKAPDIGLPAPDLVLFLDLDPLVAQARGGFGAERYEAPELQRRVREAFGRIVDDMANAKSVRWEMIDAGREMDKVAQDIEILATEVVRGPLGEVGELWRT
jgi:dTMP kinase